MNTQALILVVCLIVWAGPAVAAPCARGTLIGEVTFVRDGDTIAVGGLPIRLNGLAAPEGDERGGSNATRAMKDLVLGEEVRCVLDGEKTYDRCVAIGYLNGTDIAEVMVRRGLARDCPRFSGGRYARAEEAARLDGMAIRATYSLPGYCRSR